MPTCLVRMKQPILLLLLIIASYTSAPDIISISKPCVSRCRAVYRVRWAQTAAFSPRCSWIDELFEGAEHDGEHQVTLKRLLPYRTELPWLGLVFLLHRIVTPLVLMRRVVATSTFCFTSTGADKRPSCCWDQYLCGTTAVLQPFLPC